MSGVTLLELIHVRAGNRRCLSVPDTPDSAQELEGARRQKEGLGNRASVRNRVNGVRWICTVRLVAAVKSLSTDSPSTSQPVTYPANNMMMMNETDSEQGCVSPLPTA